MNSPLKVSCTEKMLMFLKNYKIFFARLVSYYTETLMEVLFQLVNLFCINLYEKSGTNSVHQLPFDLFHSVAHFKRNAIDHTSMQASRDNGK